MINTSNNVLPPLWTTDAATDYTYSNMGTSTGFGAVPPHSVTVTDNISVPWTFTNTALTAPNSGAKIKLTGDDADIEIGDKSLLGILEAIEKKLGLVKLNPELEEEFEELRRIGDQYREAEKRMLEKRKVWETLKR